MKKFRKPKQFVVLTLLLLCLSLFTWGSFSGILAARGYYNSDSVLDWKNVQANALASQYAPILNFAAGEQFFPTAIEYHLTRSVLKEKLETGYNVVDSHPTASVISLYSIEPSLYYLDNNLGGYQEIADDYGQAKGTLGYTVYTRVVTTSQYFIVQYWFFYAFNPGTINQHEGDWEMIEIFLDLAETPLYAAYAQHFSGEIASWNDVEKIDTHPIVYVGLGSHASYYRPYQGKIGLESDTLGNAFTLQPTDYSLTTLGGQAWLNFAGRWGDWAELADISRGMAGPSGPGHGENRDKWDDPVSWGLSTFSVNQNWFILCWVAFYFLYIFLIILAAITLWKVWVIIKRRKQGKLGIKSIMRTKASIGIILGVVGLVLYLLAMVLPWYTVRGNVQTQALQTLGETDLILIDGLNGLRINTLQSDQGFTPLFGIGIPFAIIFLASVILTVFDIIGVEKARNLSRKYIMSGITTLIPVIIIIIFITQLAGLIPQFASAFAGGAPLPAEVEQIAKSISSSPILGSYTGTLDTYGQIGVWWGLGIGAYLFIAAAIVKIIAGVAVRMIEEKTPPSSPPLPPPPPPPAVA